MNINEILSSFQNYLAGTSEFFAVKQAQAALSANPAAVAQVTAFRKKQEALYRQNAPDEQMHRLISELEQDYTKLVNYPEASAYFSALDRFDQMLGGLINELRSSLMTGAL